MNNTFSPGRFGKLFRKHTAEHYKRYVLSLTVLGGILALFIGFHTFSDRHPMDVETQYDIFVFALVLCCALFTGGIFTDLGKNEKAIATLTLPASHLEKFMVRWLYSCIIFLAAFIAVFYIVMVPIQNMAQKTGRPPALLNFFTEKSAPGVVLFFFVVHSVSLLGAIFFRKLHFIKTGFIAMLVIMLLVMGNTMVMQAVLGVPSLDAFPFSYIRFIENGHYYWVYSGTNTMMYTAAISVALILWAAAFFRLKEKQV